MLRMTGGLSRAVGAMGGAGMSAMTAKLLGGGGGIAPTLRQVIDPIMSATIPQLVEDAISRDMAELEQARREIDRDHWCSTGEPQYQDFLRRANQLVNSTRMLMTSVTALYTRSFEPHLDTQHVLSTQAGNWDQMWNSMEQLRTAIVNLYERGHWEGEAAQAYQSRLPDQSHGVAELQTGVQTQAEALRKAAALHYSINMSLFLAAIQVQQEINAALGCGHQGRVYMLRTAQAHESLTTMVAYLPRLARGEGLWRGSLEQLTGAVAQVKTQTLPDRYPSMTRGAPKHSKPARESGRAASSVTQTSTQVNGNKQTAGRGQGVSNR